MSFTAKVINQYFWMNSRDAIHGRGKANAGSYESWALKWADFTCT